MLRFRIAVSLTVVLLAGCAEKESPQDPTLAALAALQPAAASAAQTQNPTTPTGPAPTKLTPVGHNTFVTLTWAAFSGASSYKVYYSTTNGGVSLSSLVGCTTAGTTCNVTGLTNGTVYYFKISAIGTGVQANLSSQQVTKPVDGGATFAVGGNGMVEDTEQCDDGNTNNTDGCSSTFQVEGGYTCFYSPSICTN